MLPKKLNCLLLLLLAASAADSALKRPNILFIHADDLDSELGGMLPMAKTKRWLAAEGATFRNAFVTVPVCCPNRASTLTGRLQHNTHVVNNTVSGNCAGTAWRRGPEKRTYAAILQRDAGYVTFHAGKYLNQYGFGRAGGIRHVPPGWDVWLGLMGNSKFYNYSLSVDGVRKRYGDSYADGDYLTEVIGEKALDFLDSYTAKPDRPPFLMVLEVPAPHWPFTPAPQYANAFANLTAPRTPAFNHIEPASSAKHWFVSSQPRPLGAAAMGLVDEVYRDRLRTMLSVDDMVDAVMSRLESAGLLDDTYVFFSSDHGFHFGQFGMHYDKRQPYDFDLRVPLLVRGPGVAAGIVVEGLAVNIDLAPTFMDIAGLPAASDMDGVSLLPAMHEADADAPVLRTSFLVSFTGEFRGVTDPDCADVTDAAMYICDPAFACRCMDSANNSYACVRSMSDVEDSLYCEFRDDVGFVEVYDLGRDPYQLDNLANAMREDIGEEAFDGYKQRLERLKKCQGRSCIM